MYSMNNTTNGCVLTIVFITAIDTIWSSVTSQVVCNALSTSACELISSTFT